MVENHVKQLGNHEGIANNYYPALVGNIIRAVVLLTDIILDVHGAGGY